MIGSIMATNKGVMEVTITSIAMNRNLSKIEALTRDHSSKFHFNSNSNCRSHHNYDPNYHNNDHKYR